MIRILRARYVGLGLIAASLIWLGICYWMADQKWAPLRYGPIALKGEVQTPEFEVTLESTYTIGLFPPEEWNPQGGFQPPENWRWAVTSGGRTVAEGRSDSGGWYLGAFHARKGRYALRLIPGEYPDTPVSISVRECGTAWDRADWRVSNAWWLLAVVLFANLFGVAFRAITRTLDRRDAQAWADSLTQPGSRGSTPHCDSTIRRRGFPSDRFAPVRKWQALFASLSASVLLAVILPACLLQFGFQSTPTGLPVRVLRPGVEGLRTPNLDPLLIEVRRGSGHGATQLYVNAQPVTREQLGPLLDRETFRRPPEWPVYVQGEADLEWRDVALVIDSMRGKGAQVVLLTANAISDNRRAR